MREYVYFDFELFGFDDLPVGSQKCSKIVTETFISLMLELNCVTKFDRCCTL